MRAAWYEDRGAAADVLVVGEMQTPEPGPGEVRIAVAVSGVNPGDIKKRGGWQGAPMAFPRIVPHSDGAGHIDAVGPGVDPDRVGEPVWCYGAQSYRPFGTAAEYVAVPGHQAVPLPDANLADQAACLGIAGITGRQAVLGPGPLHGQTALVHGAVGGVGSIATQIALFHGAQVIAVVRDETQLVQARRLGAAHAFGSDAPDLVDQIRRVAPAGVDRIAEVDLAAHADLDAEVLAVGGVVSTYYSSEDRPTVPYWAFGFKDAAIRFLGSDDFAPEVKAAAAADLTDALVAGALRSEIARVLPLEDIVEAHELVERGAGGRVLLRIR